MKTLISIKKELEFNKGLASLIETLKNIAVAQYKSLEEKIKTHDIFFSAIESFFELIDINRIEHPFVNVYNKPLGVIAITSDSGLLGGLNMQVINRALFELENAKNVGKLIVIGEKGKSYLKTIKIPYVAFSGIREEERYSQALQLRNYILKQVLEGNYGEIKLVYPHPVSFTVQKIQVISLLPIRPLVKHKVDLLKEDLILESKISDIIEYLVMLWLGRKFYDIFGFSRLAEFSARYVHLEESLQKLKDLDNKLRLQYFKVRHELIDRNMRELFSARILYTSH